MLSQLVSQAKTEGVTHMEVSILLHKVSGFLLLEKFPLHQNGFYELPQDKLKENESFNQAICRIVMEKTCLNVERIERYLCFFDREENGYKIRRFYFIATAIDPEDIVLSEHHGFTWTKPEEGVGYPISDELRQAFDFYMKI